MGLEKESGREIARMTKSTKSKRERRPSQRLIEALLILRDRKPKTHAAFALLYWPDNHMHTRRSNAGASGTARHGNGAWLAAGSYLGKLRKRGIVTTHLSELSIRHLGIASLTAKGDAILAEYEREKASQNN